MIWQESIVLAIIVLCVVFAAMKLRKSGKGCCGSCGGAGQCGCNCAGCPGKPLVVPVRKSVSEKSTTFLFTFAAIIFNVLIP